MNPSKSAWEEAFDAESNRSYFFNRLTGETSWTLPGESTSEEAGNAAAANEWQQAFDEASQTSYYYNIHTGETSWTLPEQDIQEDISYLSFSALRLQSMFRGQRDRRKVAHLAKQRYRITRYPDTDQTLYTDLLTNASSWTKPALFVSLHIGDEDPSDDDEDVDFEAFQLEAEQDAAEEDDVDEHEPDATANLSALEKRKLKRKYPRSKAQEQVDEAEDLEENGIELDLSGLHIWKLSSRVWNLQFLKTLVLSNNELTRVPSGVQDLLHLEVLDVSHNHLTRLPSCLQTTTTLISLNASHNQIKSFSPKLWKLQSIRNLDLSFNAFQELPYVEGDLKLLRETREWQVGVGLLTNLETLKLSHNKLTEFPKSLERCTALERLDLSYNNIHSLSDECGELRSLVEFRLENNALVELPETFGNFSSLRILNLTDNRMTTLPSSIGNLQYLQQLLLRHNRLKHLPIECGALGRLSRLEIDHNIHFGTLDTFFRHLPNITLLSAPHCGLVAFQAVDLLKESPVQILRLSQNSLTDFSLSLRSLRMKDTLSELLLDGNLLSSFPMEIVRCCHQIWFLNLSGNQLRMIPAEINQLQNLEKLFLSCNELQELPEALTSLKRLRNLKCDHNQLNRLPIGMGNLAELTYLDVSFNRLQTLPTSMQMLKELQSLHANDNCLLESPPAFFRSTCFCEYSNNPFNDKQLTLRKRYSQAAQATKLVAEQDFFVAERVLSHLLADIDLPPFAEQKIQRPEQHFARGLCRLMLLQESIRVIQDNSAVVLNCEHNIEAVELLHKRKLLNEKLAAQRDRNQKENQHHDDVKNEHSKLSSALPKTPTKRVSSVSEMNAITMQTYHDAVDLRSQARAKREIYALGALMDFEEAILHKCAERPSVFYLQGLVHMAIDQFDLAIVSFTNALEVLLRTPDNIPARRESNQSLDMQSFQQQLVPATSIHIFLHRAEAYRRLGQIPMALEDVRLVLFHHPVDTKYIEDMEQAFALEWDVHQRQYFIDHETLFRSFDVAHQSGLARRPEVIDLHQIPPPAPKKLQQAKRDADPSALSTKPQLTPAQRFSVECAALSKGLELKCTQERQVWEDKYVHSQRLVARTRDFRNELRENLRLELEEAQQRAIEAELSRLAELKRQELAREFDEQMYMKYEDELMKWLVSEEQRIEMERLRALEAAQKRLEQKAALATRMARRGGRRQQGPAVAAAPRNASPLKKQAPGSPKK